MGEVVYGDLKVGDRVVYPNQGICRVKGREKRQIAGREWEFVALAREEDGAMVMVPTDKVASVGLRKVATDTEIRTLFEFLAEPPEDPELDWKLRARGNVERMSSGGLREVAEVLKGLHALAVRRPLPQKERELYDQARHLLVNEVAASVGLPPVVAEHQIDLALVPVETSTTPRPRPAPRPAPPPADDLADVLGQGAEAAAPEAESEEEEAPRPAPKAKPAPRKTAPPKAKAKTKAKAKPLARAKSRSAPKAKAKKPAPKPKKKKSR